MATTIGKASGFLAAGNPDNYYTFTFDTAQTLNLDVNYSFGSGAVALYDAANVRLSSDSGNQYGDAWINRVVAAGTYYVDVYGSGNAAYTLTTSLGGSPVGPINVDTAGGTLATARAIGIVGSTSITVTDAIDYYDTDYYSFNVAGPSQVNVTLSGPSASVYLTNASGQTLYSDPSSAGSNGSINAILSALTPGTYFLKVTGSSSTPAGYNLSLAATPIPTIAGSTLATARSFGTLGQTTQRVSDSLNYNVTTEYYSFSVSGPSSVTLNLSGLTDTATISLRDAGGNVMYSANGSFGNGSVDIFTYLPPLSLGTYYISVQSSLNNTEILPYTLSATASPVVDSGGNTLASATPLGLVGTATTVRAGYLGTVNPADYYSFSLATGANLSVYFSATYDEYFTLYSSTGAALGPTFHETNGAFTATYTLAAGSYYASAAPASGEEESYVLKLTTSAPTLGTSASNAAGTTVATAKSLGGLTQAPIEIAEWVGTGNLDDWYSFTLASAGRVHLDLAGNGLPMNLYLLGITQNSIASDGGSRTTFTAGAVESGASIWQTLSAGTYYIHAQATSSSSITGYHLSASVVPSADASLLPDIAGNTTATGLNIGTLGTAVQTFSDYVGRTDSDDYFQFNLTALSRVNVKLSNDVSSGYDSIVYIRDVSGNSISYDYESFHYTGNLQQILAPGIYFVDVHNSTGNSYTLTMSATPLATTASSALSTASSFLPTAAGVSAQIDTLETQVKSGSLASISLSDVGTPSITITYAQAVADIDALKAIITPYNLSLIGTPEKWAAPTLLSLGLAGTAVQNILFADGRFSFTTTDPGAAVYRMYLSALGRAPDPAGQHSWNRIIESGGSLVTMAQGFIGSPEFIARYGSSLTDTQFITLLYRNVLGRTPDSGGLSGWQSALAGGQSRAQVLVAFSESPEHIASTAANVQAGLWDLDENAAQIARLYDTVLGRLPDSGGLAGWANGLRAGTVTLQSAAAAFVASAEFQAIYGSLGNSAFVSTLYINALHRPADSAGLADWVNRLNTGTSRATVVLGFSESAEHQANTAANILNPSLSQQGILTVGPVLATGAVIGGALDQFETLVKARTVTGLGVGDSGVGAVPITTAQLTTDKDALSIITGNFYLDMHDVSSAAGAAALAAANLGNTTAAKYVQLSNGRLVFDIYDRAAQVYRLYDSALGRVPDAVGEHNGSLVLASGTPMTSLAQIFVDSTEFTNRYGVDVSDTAYVTLLYQNVLHRAPDSGGLNNWLTQLGSGSTRAKVLIAFSESPEHIINTTPAIHAGLYDVS